MLGDPGARVASMHDAADLTNSLADWVRGVLPDAVVWIASGESPDPAKPASDKEVTVRLARIEGLRGPRSVESVSGRLALEYGFDVRYADPVAGHQALADLAFAMLDRDDAGDLVRGDNGALSATFVLDRRRDLPRARPVREAVFDLQPQGRFAGFVRAENGFPIARAKLQIRDSDRLIITGSDGGFAFAAPADLTIRATVSAKGKRADVELKPGDSNLITLAMEP
jgi:hypothetical protein